MDNKPADSVDQNLPDHDEKKVEPVVQKSSWLTSLFQTGRQYFFQFFMLFLAVAAGFFTENLREEFSERKQAREYAYSLINDLTRDTQNMEYHLARLERTANSINELANYVRGKKIEQLENVELYRLTLMVPNTPYRWSRATIEQIKSSGSLRYFTNDSIVYYISQYDSWTLHLDQDNFLDQQKFLKAFEMRIKVVDMNYLEAFTKGLKSNPDSLLQTRYYGEIASTLTLLTKDINEVHAMINAYIIVKDYYKGRMAELSLLVHDQNRLIHLIKHEYQWD